MQQNVATVLTLGAAGAGIGAASAYLASPKHLRQGASVLNPWRNSPANFAKGVAAFPVHVARGLIADRQAMANPDAFRVLADPADREVLSGISGAISGAWDATKQYRASLKAVGKYQQRALGQFAGNAALGGAGIARVERAGTGARIHLDDGRTFTSRANKLLNQYLSASERATAARALVGERVQGIGSAVRQVSPGLVGRMLDPRNLYAGLRGWASRTPTSGMLRLGFSAPLGLGNSLDVAVPTTYRGASALMGHTLGRGITAAIKRVPHAAAGVIGDLAAGAGHDLLGMKKAGWRGSSHIIRAARFLAVAKGFLPLKDDIYNNTLASSDAFYGNPMLSGLANAGARRLSPDAFEAGYGADLSPDLRATGSRPRGVHSESFNRFAQSAAGLSLSLSRIGGRAL